MTLHVGKHLTFAFGNGHRKGCISSYCEVVEHGLFGQVWLVTHGERK